MAAFAAATIAGASPLKTGMQAMRLGVAKYFLPFFFVLNPALIFKGSWPDILQTFTTCLAGVCLIGGALEGYLLFVGRILLQTRVIIFVSGLLLYHPSTTTDRNGLVVMIGGLLIWMITDRKKMATRMEISTSR